MTALAPTLQAFFTQRLTIDRNASPHTLASYRDTWRLLLTFTAERTSTPPHRLDIAQLDAGCVTAFLEHLQAVRGNSVRTRNNRLAGIHSLFRFAAHRHPEHADTIARVLAIPPKRYERALITYLTEAETAALLAAPDRCTWTGRRDHAMLATAVQTGLRISELTGLRNGDVHLGTGPHMRCTGKGRKQRITPLTRTTVAILRTWQQERSGQPDDPLFPTRQGHPLSRDAVEHRIAAHVKTAQLTCPSLQTKNVTAHVLRHTAAMRLLQAGVDTTVIALWLGHEKAETTQIYLHADLNIKERALERTRQPDSPPGRYRPTDATLTWLSDL